MMVKDSVEVANIGYANIHHGKNVVICGDGEEWKAVAMRMQELIQKWWKFSLTCLVAG